MDDGVASSSLLLLLAARRSLADSASESVSKCDMVMCGVKFLEEPLEDWSLQVGKAPSSFFWRVIRGGASSTMVSFSSSGALVIVDDDDDDDSGDNQRTPL